MKQEAVLFAPPTAPVTTFPLVEKLGAYLVLSSAEVEFLRNLHGQRRQIKRHREIVVAGHRYDQLFILCSGIVSRYKVLADGKRQILSLGLPGDFIGFPSCLFEVAVNSVSSLTDVVVCPVPFGNLFDLFVRFPRVGTALFWSTACETAMYAEHLVDIGRRSAYERTRSPNPGTAGTPACGGSRRRVVLYTPADAGVDGGCTLDSADHISTA